MSTRLLAASWREVRPVLVWQVAGIAVLGGVFAATLGAKAGWAALVGSGIGFTGIAYLMVAVLKSSLRPGAGSVAGIFASWLIKVTLTLGLLLLALRSRAFPPLPLLAGLCGSLVAYWLAMMRAGRGQHAGNANGE